MPLVHQRLLIMQEISKNDSSKRHWKRFFRISSIISLMSGDVVGAYIDNEQTKNLDTQLNQQDPANMPQENLAATNTEFYSVKWQLVFAWGFLSTPILVIFAALCVISIIMTLGFALYPLLIFITYPLILGVAMLVIYINARAVKSLNVTFYKETSFVSIVTPAVLFWYFYLQRTWPMYPVIFLGIIILPLSVWLTENTKTPVFYKNLILGIGIFISIGGLYLKFVLRD